MPNTEPRTERSERELCIKPHDVVLATRWLRRSVRPGDLDDAVQDVCIIFHRQLPEWRQLCSRSTYLFAIVRLYVRDYWRRRRRERMQLVDFNDDAVKDGKLYGTADNLLHAAPADAELSARLLAEQWPDLFQTLLHEVSPAQGEALRRMLAEEPSLSDKERVLRLRARVRAREVLRHRGIGSVDAQTWPRRPCSRCLGPRHAARPCRNPAS